MCAHLPAMTLGGIRMRFDSTPEAGSEAGAAARAEAGRFMGCESVAFVLALAAVLGLEELAFALFLAFGFPLGATPSTSVASAVPGGSATAAVGFSASAFFFTFLGPAFAFATAFSAGAGPSLT